MKSRNCRHRWTFLGPNLTTVLWFFRPVSYRRPTIPGTLRHRKYWTYKTGPKFTVNWIKVLKKSNLFTSIRRTVFPVASSIRYLGYKMLHSWDTYPMAFPGGAITSIRWRQQKQQQEVHRSGRYKWITSLWLLSKIFISKGLRGPQQFRVQQSVSVFQIILFYKLIYNSIDSMKVIDFWDQNNMYLKNRWELLESILIK